MAYVDPDFRTKQELREYVNILGNRPALYVPGGLYPPTQNGIGFVEGPHAPMAHRWYAQVEVRDGKVVKVL